MKTYKNKFYRSALIVLGSLLLHFVPHPSILAAEKDYRSGSTKAKINTTHSSYILGPGDSLVLEILNIPELSGTFSIGPDGTVYLPRIRALYVEGLTVEELRKFLADQFSDYVKDPQIFLTPVSYRSVRVYVGGEVSRPGYYMLSNGLITPGLRAI